MIDLAGIKELYMSGSFGGQYYMVVVREKYKVTGFINEAKAAEIVMQVHALVCTGEWVVLPAQSGWIARPEALITKVTS